MRGYCQFSEHKPLETSCYAHKMAVGHEICYDAMKEEANLNLDMAQIADNWICLWKFYIAVSNENYGTRSQDGVGSEARIWGCAHIECDSEQDSNKRTDFGGQLEVH